MNQNLKRKTTGPGNGGNGLANKKAKEEASTKTKPVESSQTQVNQAKEGHAKKPRRQNNEEFLRVPIGQFFSVVQIANGQASFRASKMTRLVEDAQKAAIHAMPRANKDQSTALNEILERLKRLENGLGTTGSAVNGKTGSSPASESPDEEKTPEDMGVDVIIE